MSEDTNEVKSVEPAMLSTLEGFYNLGFTMIGDSRDFSNNSIQVLLARGHERISWTFPMKAGKVGVTLETGHSYIQVPVSHLSFDVVVPPKK